MGSMGSFESSDVPYFTLNLSWALPPVWASNLALLIQGKRISKLKFQQELTIAGFLKVLEKELLSAPLSFQKWHFCIKVELHGHHQGRKR